ncbi:phage tail protein [Paludibacterium paludis]|uniref:Tail protein n=1 Tax=Paludibacterium paludis TaxID=1225769 RepID=A0A918U825_9NEIS|nr:phage tail protein [Paludibacterium paludis]GGY07121.1 tail protein [Paludibacterium paludis]
MPVYPVGQLNTAALQTPGVYIQVIPPKTRVINGVPTDIYGQVGVASWGPVNAPTLVGSPTDAVGLFGTQQVRKYDLASAIAVGMQIGATNQRIVRVTDGTDTAATAKLMDSAASAAVGMTLTAQYTGTVGNTLTASLSAGTRPNSFKLMVQRQGFAPEIFDGITGSGAALWSSLVSAVNNGISSVRGPSTLVTATVGASSAAPALGAVVNFAGGTDGAAGVNDASLIGSDGTVRKGMYALRGSGVQVMNLVDLTDATQWPNIAAFCAAEGVYGFTQGAAGASCQTVSTALNTSGVDSPYLKVLVGDWIYWQDTVNGQNRMMAPASFLAARCAALAPHMSTLNKPIGNATGTQRVAQNQPYSGAEIGSVVGARLDVVGNPSPGGNYYAGQTGRNTSSDPTRNGDNYTRMTNFIALTLAGAFGYAIGQNQTPDLRREVKSAIETFLLNLQRQNMIGDVNGGPSFSVKLDKENNPDDRVALGYMQADVQVKYLSVIFYFIVNLEAGQSVTVQVANNPR